MTATRPLWFLGTHLISYALVLTVALLVLRRLHGKEGIPTIGIVATVIFVLPLSGCCCIALLTPVGGILSSVLASHGMSSSPSDVDYAIAPVISLPSTTASYHYLLCPLSRLYAFEFDLTEADFCAWLAVYKAEPRPVESIESIISARQSESADSLAWDRVEDGLVFEGRIGKRVDHVHAVYDRSTQRAYLVVERFR